MTLRRTGRLRSFSYVGLYRYFLTFCTDRRQPAFKERAIVEAVLAHLLRSSVVHEFAIPAYCFMPDHLHLLVEGRTDNADLMKFAARFKQQSGYAFAQSTGRRLWQAGYHDHILRCEEASLRIAKYIVENPVRAKLVRVYDEHPYSGSDTYSLIELAEAIAWEPNWRSEPNPQG